MDYFSEKMLTKENRPISNILLFKYVTAVPDINASLAILRDNIVRGKRKFRK